MVRPLALLATLLATSMAVSLSGCVTDGDCSNTAEGQSCSTGGSLGYNGASNGSDSSSKACGTSANIETGGNMGTGSVKVTVKDGGGATAYSKTFSAPGQFGESKALTGKAGTWTVAVERGSGNYGSFSGQYGIHLTC